MSSREKDCKARESRCASPSSADDLHSRLAGHQELIDLRVDIAAAADYPALHSLLRGQHRLVPPRVWMPTTPLVSYIAKATLEVNADRARMT